VSDSERMTQKLTVSTIFSFLIHASRRRAPLDSRFRGNDAWSLMHKPTPRALASQAHKVHSKMFWRFTATAVLLILLALGGASDCSAGPPLSELFTFQTPPEAVPALWLKDGTERGHTLHELMEKEFRGRTILLNIWATWCGPCVKEIASLDALQAELGPKGLIVIAVSVDREGAAALPAFYKRHSLKNLNVFLDPEGLILTRLHLHGIPATLLINPAGEEIGRVIGGVDWMQEDNVAFLEWLIPAPTGQGLR